MLCLIHLAHAQSQKYILLPKRTQSNTILAKVSNQHPTSHAINYRNLLPDENEDKKAKRSKILQITGCISLGVCAGLVVAGTTLATKPIGNYTEGVIMLAAGGGFGVLSIPLLVLANHHKK